MYRYTIGNAVTYTPDDLDLFRESPFALWMERLTLENPDHGILPDVPSSAPPTSPVAPTGLVETLRAEGKQVATVAPDLDEPERREVTLVAMHEGADFIAHGQLAVGAFSASSQLLMRTSGYSDLGDFLYIPCEPEVGGSFLSGFRVAFVAHLLHTLQGQLPPQMLIIRDGTDVVPLQTEDHIYYFWSVLGRFEQAMKNFRKHRMPDPSESCHFGRWSDCASEVLKQRAQNEQARSEEAVEESAADAVEIPPLLVAAGATGTRETVSAAPGAGRTPDDVADSAGSARSPRSDAGPTLAEQARMLEPGSYRAVEAPGHTPNLARFPRPARDSGEAGGPGRAGEADEEALQSPSGQAPPVREVRPVADATLENLQFIGSSGIEPPPETAGARREEPSAPAASLRAGVPDEPLELDDPLPSDEFLQLDESLPLPEPGILDEAGRELDVPRFLPPDPSGSGKPAGAAEGRAEPTGEETPSTAAVPEYARPPAVDLDSAPSPALAPVRPVRPKNREPGEDASVAIGSATSAPDRGDKERAGANPRPFDARLHTSEDFEDEDEDR